MLPCFLPIKQLVASVLIFVLATFHANGLERGTPGPLGFSDIRAAMLPPPGLYGAVTYTHVRNRKLNDGNGKPVAFLNSLRSNTNAAALAFLYVPDLNIFGGSVGLTAAFSGGVICGRLFSFTDERCLQGLRDPYIELAWSRFFGTFRPSNHDAALPILEGLAVRLGLGVVVPIGRYDVSDSLTHGLSIGHNIWDIAPNLALTYTTAPIVGEGTEFSAKVSFNEYLPNPRTNYSTGDLINVDFAVSERLGRWQLGVGGNYYLQIEDDKQFGATVGRDGRRARALNLGVVGSYDMPEIESSLRFKAVTSAMNRNLPDATSFSLTLIKKLR